MVVLRVGAGKASPCGAQLFNAATGLRSRAALGAPADHALGAAAIALGIFVAWALVDWPSVALLLLGIVLFVHRFGHVARMRQQAWSDPKTGLLKESSWSEAAAAELLRARRTGYDTGLLVLDLDHFECVNDWHGHLVGDNILCAVADTLRAELRAGDLVGRLGGQQFVILLPGTGKFDALAIAERIRCRVAATTVYVATPDTQSRFVGVTVSIGVTAHPHDGTTLGALLEAANRALREAKADGHNRAVGSAVASRQEIKPS
jgi:diguanylate cyclase (GGDEF)-like protein